MFILNNLSQKYPNNATVVQGYAYFLEHVKHDIDGAKQKTASLGIDQLEAQDKDASANSKSRRNSFSRVSSVPTNLDPESMYEQSAASMTEYNNKNPFATDSTALVAAVANSAEDAPTEASSANQTQSTEYKKRMILKPDTSWFLLLIITSISFIFAIYLLLLFVIINVNLSSFNLTWLWNSCTQSVKPYKLLNVLKKYELTKKYLNTTVDLSSYQSTIQQVKTNNSKVLSEINSIIYYKNFEKETQLRQKLYNINSPAIYNETIMIFNRSLTALDISMFSKTHVNTI